MLLVTGITGHTGNYFLQELIKNNYTNTIRCIVLDNCDTSVLDQSGLKIEKIIGNLENEEVINKAMIGVDIVMHIYNIRHSVSIIKAAIKNNVKRVVLVHTTGIYSKFKSASEEYKNIEENISKLLDIAPYKPKITIIRPTMIYGDLCDRNMSKFIKFIDKFKIIPVINNGNNLIQPINARDLGRAYYNVITNENTADKEYILSGDRPIKMIEVYKIISKILNKKRIFINISLNLGVLGAKIIKIFTVNKVDFIEKVQRMGEDRSFLHKKATSDFNFKPIKFEDGMQIEIEQYITNKTCN